MKKSKKSDTSVSMIYPGNKKMSALLKSYNSQLDLGELKALIAGAVLAVEMVPPSFIYFQKLRPYVGGGRRV